MPGLLFSSCLSQRSHLLFAILPLWIEFSVYDQLFYSYLVFFPLPLQGVAYLNKGLVLLICYFHVSYLYSLQWNFYIILLLAGSSINYCQERH